MTLRQAKDPPTILAVDDLQDNLKLLERLLAPRGYHVVTAETGAQALECFKEVCPDVVLLDLIMPCLLYTSDAADDLLCVDLGGRRIIKKKKHNNHISNTEHAIYHRHINNS